MFLKPPTSGYSFAPNKLMVQNRGASAYPPLSTACPWDTVSLSAPFSLGAPLTMGSFCLAPFQWALDPSLPINPQMLKVQHNRVYTAQSGLFPI